jgi:hypothetical protein
MTGAAVPTPAPVRCLQCPSAPSPSWRCTPIPTTKRSARAGSWPATAPRGCAPCWSPAPMASWATRPAGSSPTSRGTTRRRGAPRRHGARGQLPRSWASPTSSCLGYHDSGMEGWPQNDAPDSFWRAPVAEAGSRLAELMRRYRAPGRRHLRRERLLRAPRPHSGQPDHPRRHRRVRHTRQALLHRHAPLGGCTGSARVMAEAGHRGPDRGAGEPRLRHAGRADHHDVDCSAVAGRRSTRRSAAHASQSDNIFFLRRWARSSSAPSWPARPHGCSDGELRAPVQDSPMRPPLAGAWRWGIDRPPLWPAWRFVRPPLPAPGLRPGLLHDERRPPAGRRGGPGGADPGVAPRAGLRSPAGIGHLVGADHHPESDH